MRIFLCFVVQCLTLGLLDGEVQWRDGLRVTFKRARWWRWLK